MMVSVVMAVISLFLFKKLADNFSVIHKESESLGDQAQGVRIRKAAFLVVLFAMSGMAFLSKALLKFFPFLAQ